MRDNEGPRMLIQMGKWHVLFGTVRVSGDESLTMFCRLYL